MAQGKSAWLWVERAANVGIVLAVCLLVWQLRPSARAGRAPSEVVAVGDRVATQGSTALRSSGQLLVVFRSSCMFCVASLPFYRELLDMGAGDGLAFVAPAGEETATASALQNAGMGSVPLLTADFGKNRFHVTPLVLSVDKQWNVRRIWRGRLSPSAQAEVRMALQAIVGERRPVASSNVSRY